MELILDTREHDLINLITLPKTVKQLDIGDILINNPDGLSILIERKTINDLIASIKDGRYKEQKARLQTYQGQVIYIIEGTLLKSNSYYEHIKGAIVSISLSNFKVIQTKNIEETVEIINKIYSKLPEKKENISGGYIENIQVKKKENYTPELFYLLILSQIPKVSKKMAQEISLKYSNLEILINEIKTNDTINISKIEIQHEKTKRKIGEKIAQTIKSYLINN
jgi:ERCC4-type nuclease